MCVGGIIYKMHVWYIQMESVKQKYLDNEKERDAWLAQNRRDRNI